MSSHRSSSGERKTLLDIEDFERALKLLDVEMSKNDFLNAFAPINVVTVGGFVALRFFKNRLATGDLDYIIDPEWSGDEEIGVPLKNAIKYVAEKEKLEHHWMNDELQIWASPAACKTIFEQAYTQNIILFDGEAIKVWAAPFEWGLERKLRRVATSQSDRDSKADIDDLLVHFRYFRTANGGPLDMEYFRTLNMNGFEMAPDVRHMEIVATQYRKVYNENLF